MDTVLIEAQVYKGNILEDTYLEYLDIGSLGGSPSWARVVSSLLGRCHTRPSTAARAAQLDLNYFAHTKSTLGTLPEILMRRDDAYLRVNPADLVSACPDPLEVIVRYNP